MAWPKINHIKVDIFPKKRRLSVVRTFVHGDQKGGAWIAGGGDNNGHRRLVGVWSGTRGVVDRLSARLEPPDKPEFSEQEITAPANIKDD